LNFSAMLHSKKKATRFLFFLRSKLSNKTIKSVFAAFAARNDRTIRAVGQSVAIGDKHFEVVKEFLYLRSLMTPTNDVSLEVQRRIQVLLWTAQTSAVDPPFTLDKIHHSQDLEPPSPALRQ
jgi:hypothetical protein